MEKDYEREGENALIHSKPCPENPELRIAADIEAQIIHLRTTYHLGQYEKQVRGHKIQVDVNFLSFTDKSSGREVKRFQYTAIDDATRAWRLKYIIA